MLKSSIEMKNGLPCLYIDGKTTAAMAYTTYFEERNRYEDFANAGYRIFFVNLTFTTLPINTETGFSPFCVGVFDDRNNPDYSEFEGAVHKILSVCPDAVIFPRIYVSMPKWWVNENPDEVAPTVNSGSREIMFSEVFRKDGEGLLREVIEHIKASDYKSRIGGWMLCGGLTQEWIYRHYRGDICDGAKKYYRRWAKEKYGIDGAELPDIEEYVSKSSDDCQVLENAQRYSLFCNTEMAKTLEHFAKVTKEATDYAQVVGAFYGYTFQGSMANFGHYALRYLIDSPYLDYFSSPNAYTNEREFGIDWADMIPVDSLKAHGKLAFIECDIRTYLTTSVQEARPGVYPDGIYKTNGKSVWAGPPTAELSREALRKSFAHQLTKGSAIWWFDMWGGWYDDPILMEALAGMKKIYGAPLVSDTSLPSAEVVFFADEQAKTRIKQTSRRHIRCSLVATGRTGAPYDTCMAEDAQAVLNKYKAAIFPSYIHSEAGKRAIELCKQMGIPYLLATEEHREFTTEEIRAFIEKSGAHIYAEENTVVYAGNGYIALHSTAGGKKRLRLPKVFTVSPIFGADIKAQVTDVIEFELKENATALFSIS